ncbi:MAG: iron ABC transporter permease [Candidatus Riflebacteria bacterium]|nr:iron ABC transporter permease [Candidatus Riflebacteria bacterium]
MKPVTALAIGFLIMAITGFLCLCLGSERSVHPFDLTVWQNAFADKWEYRELILFSVRLPRLVLGLIVGGSLALAGLVFQSLLRNPLADPFILGVSGGSGLAAVLIQLSGIHRPLVLVCGAFMGGVGAMFLVQMLAGSGGKIDRGRLILAGVVLNAFFAALISLVLILAGKDLPRIFAWLMGSLSVPEPALFKPLAVVSIITSAILWVYSHRLNLIALGDHQAYHLGIPPEGTKKVALLCASLLTAIAVSLAGMIGFIGMFVPHAVRLVFGSDHKILIPATFSVGAGLLMFADTLARISPTGVELPVGTLTALFGAPFFLSLLLKSGHSQ